MNLTYDQATEVLKTHDAWQYLVDSGLAWSLQGWFGRNAAALIEAGVIEKPKGA